MEYILTKEEFENLVPKEELENSNNQLKAVVDAFRNTDFCIRHRYGTDCYCDDCPIASINITDRGYWKPCIYQRFSK